MMYMSINTVHEAHMTSFATLEIHNIASMPWADGLSHMQVCRQMWCSLAVWFLRYARGQTSKQSFVPLPTTAVLKHYDMLLTLLHVLALTLAVCIYYCNHILRPSSHRHFSRNIQTQTENIFVCSVTVGSAH